MGGNAFLRVLRDDAFQRLPHQVYILVKARLIPHLQELYAHVAVPAEAPEKLTHGDLDFVVAQPRTIGDPQRTASPEDVKSKIGATHCIPMPGNRTSHFAVPIPMEEWPRDEGDERYCQVDVHLCEDTEEWGRIVFFHGYGDLGMILGLVARNNGLSLGTNGLKIGNPPNPPFLLSKSPSAIMDFFGLSMHRWKEGFSTQRGVFEWVASSRFFTTGRPFTGVCKEKQPRERRIKDDRKMYWAFLVWATEREQETGRAVTGESFNERTFHAEALEHFDKRAEFDALLESSAQRRYVKSKFNAVMVAEWTGLNLRLRGKDLKRIMDAVRERYGGNGGVAKFVEEEGEEQVKKVVLDVWDNMRTGLNAGL